MKTKFTIVAFAAALAWADTAGASPRSLEPWGDLPISQYVEPVYPVALSFESIHEGYAEVGFVVGPDGGLVEVFATEFSHPAFAAEVEGTVKLWKFEPLAAGQPALNRRHFLRFNFRREGVVTISNQIDAFMNRIWAMAGREGVRVCKMRDLDQIPDVVSIVVPGYPAEMKTRRTAGTALVSFYIDETGTVRVPGVVESSGPEFASAALIALKQWRFAPPTRRQMPVRVFAVQEFLFKPELPAATGTAK